MMRFAFVTIFIALTLPAPAQKIATWGEAQRTVRYEYRLMNPAARAAENVEGNGLLVRAPYCLPYCR